MLFGGRPAVSREIAYMRRALCLARRGWGQTAPNPMVGAVIVRDGEIAGEGFHARFGEEHAEAMALRIAGDRARGATVYVTLEPCSHAGKTPPCADALIRARVSRVVAATRDPNPAAAGGLERLREAGIAVESGLEEEASRELNAPFFHSFRSARPWVTLKLAISLDGAIADASGKSRWLTGEAARREVHRLRAGNDAIAVGIGTVLADDPALTVRGVRRPRLPLRRVVFDRRARLPPGSQLALSARQTGTIVVTETPDDARVARLSEAGVEVVRTTSLGNALDQLASRDIRSLLVEGGARLAGALLMSAAVDRLIIFQAPVVLGTGALHAFADASPTGAPAGWRLRVLARKRFGDDLMSVYAPPGDQCSQD